MDMREGARAPVRFLILFVLMAGIPLVVLGLATWRLAEQDRDREAEQLRKRLDSAASVVATALEHELADWEEGLDAASRGDHSRIPPGAAVVLFNSSGVVARYGAALPYYPQIAPVAPASDELFAQPEVAEFADEDLAQAASLYRTLAETDDPRVRAGALMRLARCLRNQKLSADALKVYDALAALADTPVGSNGEPSELVARGARIALFEKAGAIDARRREAEHLSDVLAQGRFLIDRSTFDFYSGLGLVSDSSPVSAPLADAVEGLWPLWRQQQAGRVAWDAGARFVGVWKPVSTGTAAMVGPADMLMERSSASLRDPDFRFALEDSTEQVVWGTVFFEGVETRRSLREAGLPWVIRVSADGNAVLQSGASRRNLLAAGFALMAVVIGAASYFVFSALTREFRMARLQSEFVSAVSHEFRTPLAAMRHLTDLLEEGGAPPDRLTSFYSALGKEARRLQAMVESLLDFARFESGRHAYDMQEHDATELTTELVNEFCEQRRLAPGRVEWRSPCDAVPVRADREALALAVRNLLDNAVKYSPESSRVSVSVERRGGTVRISVEDHGPGIGANEKRDIFRRFVRGRAAKTLNVKGTGIGLAMAQGIVGAHGGRIEVESREGQGSRFTVVLPLAPHTAPDVRSNS